MKEIKAGVYTAQISDYAITKTKKGLPMAMIRLVFQDSEKESHSITWYGTFGSEKASEITCEALAVCGWTTNNPADLAKGFGSGVLAENKEISITVASEEWEGKTTMKVKYINPVGGQGFRDKMSQAEAAQLFSGLNLGGVAAAARKKHTKVIPNMAPKFDADEPIPF